MYYTSEWFFENSRAHDIFTDKDKKIVGTESNGISLEELRASYIQILNV